MKYTKNWGKENLDRKSQQEKSTVNGWSMDEDDVEMTSADQWMLTQLGMTW